MNEPAERSLRFNFSWTLLGNAVFVLCQWGIIVLLAREAPKLIGQYALGLAIATPAFALSSLALRPLHVTDSKRQYSFGNYFALRLILTSLVFLAILLLYPLVGGIDDTAHVVIVVAAIKAFETVSDLLYGFFQKLERMDHIARSKMLKGITTVFILWIAMDRGLALATALSGVLMVRTGIFLAYDLVQAILYSKRMNRPIHDLKPDWSFPTMYSLLWTAMPMGAVLFLISLTQHMPNLILEQSFGEETLGIFATLASILLAGNQVISAMGEAASPRLAKHHDPQDLRAFHALLFRMVAGAAGIGISGTLIANFFGHSLLTLIFDPEYAEYNHILTLLMIASIFTYPSVALGFGATASRRLKQQPRVVFISAFLTFFACMLLIPAYGMTGAAWAVIFSAVVRVFAYAYLFRFPTDGV